VSAAARLSPTPEQVVWHDLECGSYEADLDLWRQLAGGARSGHAPARVLDIGAGSGRVALALARAGHRVTALDRDPELLAALRERARGLPLRTELADARDFHLRGPAYDLALMPMQTLQLLGGPRGRHAALVCAGAHLRAGAALACAIVTEVEPFAVAAGHGGPSPERLETGGRLYESRAVAVTLTAATIRIERERVVHHRSGPGDRGPRAVRDVVELERLGEQQLWRDARAVGLEPLPSRAIAETRDHAGSLVVMLGA
jgi:SAM-dependent methyltransferase